MSKSSSEFSIGELFWAKIGSYPYWPCIISASPGTQTFQRSAKKGSLIHVHFFGDNGKHSWVSSSALMAFKGLDEFNKLKSNKSGDPNKAAPGFIVKSNLKSAWDHAVKEIESVLTKDVSKRIDEYHNLYPLKYDHGGNSSKRKSVSSEESVPPAKVVKSAPPKKAIKATAIESLQNGSSEDSKSTKQSSKAEPVPEHKVEPVPVSKSKKAEPVKKESKRKAESKKDVEATNASGGGATTTTSTSSTVASNSKSEQTDLSSFLTTINETLALAVHNKKQLSLAKKLVEQVVRLAVDSQLTDKLDVK